MVEFIYRNGMCRADFMTAVATHANLLVNDDAFSLKVQCVYRAYLNTFAALDTRLGKEYRCLALAFHARANVLAEEEGGDEGMKEACLFLLGYTLEALHH